MSNKPVKCLLSALLFLGASIASAQSVPNGGAVTQGQIWTVAQWNSAWASKADVTSPNFLGSLRINGATVPSIVGTPTTGDCVQWSSAFTIGDAGAPCGSGGGSSAFSALTGGTDTAASMVVGSGASINTSGTGFISATKLNGTALSGLATGLLKNTTATGVPSIATSADIIADWTGSCSGSTFLRGDGSCQTPAGGGNVSNSGTPTNHQTGVWTSATTLQGVGPGTTGQAFASGGASADPSFSASLSGVTSVNGSTVPSSSTLAGLGIAETWTALQTITNSDLALLGSSTGATTFASANAGASNFTLTFPAITDTLVTLTATQTLTNKSIAASEVNTGTLAGGQMPALTGDVTSSSGTVATTVGKINGTSLGGLATGLLKNTTTTGVPSIATSADVIADWSGTCSSSTFLRGDGSCQTPAGSGTVTTSGSPVSGNLAKFSGSTVVTSGDLSGDVTTSGTLAATVVKVNGATVPASAAVLASNSSSQLTALTLGSNLVISSGVLGTSQTINAQTGTSYAILSTDAGKLITFNNASATAVSIAAAGSAGFLSGYSIDVENLGAGTVTITPTTSTVNGASTLVITTNEGCTISSDGANYQVSACTAVFSGGGGSGTITSSTSGQIPVYTAATTVAGSANATLTAGALTLGVSGTPGSVKMGNASSGTVTLQPVTGALGSVTASLPAATDTIVELTQTQTLTNKTLTAPTLTAPVLGTPASGTLTNATGLPFSGIATGSNTTATMTVGTGGTLTVSGTGVNNANQVNGATVPVSVPLASNSSGQLVASGVTVSPQVATTYTVLSTDARSLLTFSNASAIAVTLPQATGSFAVPFYVGVQNTGAGAVTITPTTSTINGVATLVLSQNQGCTIISDGTNYQIANCTASLASSLPSGSTNTLTGNWNVSGTLQTLGALKLGGTTFTVASGTGACATTSTLVGGNTAGKFTCTGTTGASTVTLTLGAVTHEYSCAGRDITTPTVLTQTGAISTTSVTLTMTSVTANDVVQFHCLGY